MGFQTLEVVGSSGSKPCLTLRRPRDCRRPGFSVHGIFHARILEWVAIFQRIFPTQGSNPRLLPGRRILYHCLFCPWRGPKCSSREPIVGCILLLTFYCLSASSHCISKPLSKVICGRELKFGLCLAQEVYQYAFSVKKKIISESLRGTMVPS